MAAIVPGVIERWFTPRFQKADPAAVERIASMLRDTPPQGYVACCAAVRDMDQRAEIAAISAPTLVIAGTHDGATPPAQAQLIAAEIPGAALVDLDAAHLSNIEQADLFTRNLVGFLSMSETSNG
jgi:3-oxoadipate enol-lactonase